MAKAQKVDTNFTCRCSNDTFIIARSYDSGGSKGYVLRCGACNSFVKNVNELTLKALYAKQRIVKARQPDDMDNIPPASPSSCNTSGNNAVHNSAFDTTSYGMQSMGVQGTQDSVPWDVTPPQKVAVPPAPGYAPPAPKPEVPAPPPAVQNTPVQAPQRPDCILCRQHLSIAIPNTQYAMSISKNNLEYFDSNTMAILFTHKIGFCPICGFSLDTKG